MLFRSLSAGLEDEEDLLADVLQALDAVRAWQDGPTAAIALAVEAQACPA